jgi:hypothetical protein
MEALEQRQAEHLLQVFNLLAHCPWRNREFLRRQLEAEVATGSLEGTQAIEGRQSITHGSLATISIWGSQ